MENKNKEHIYNLVGGLWWEYLKANNLDTHTSDIKFDFNNEYNKFKLWLTETMDAEQSNIWN